MALQAEEGFILPEHVVHHRSVRVVATLAAFFHGGMLKDKRALQAGMAGIAHVVRALIGGDHVRLSAVDVMATGARHTAFHDGVMRTVVDLCPLLLVAIEAKLWLALAE